MKVSPVSKVLVPYYFSLVITTLVIETLICNYIFLSIVWAIALTCPYWNKLAKDWRNQAIESDMTPEEINSAIKKYGLDCTGTLKLKLSER